MSVTNPAGLTHGPDILPPALCALLARFRQARGFSPVSHAHAKAELLNAYLRANGLKACVVAVSGGLDSAVVLKLVTSAQRQADSPIENVTAILAPIFGATSGQDVATQRGLAVCQACGVTGHVIDLTPAHAELAQTTETAVGMPGQPWARGKFASNLRTPVLYHVTGLLAERGLPAVLVGTTNRDKGAYLGYVGRASDGMVDLQLLADLHKSEVRTLAQSLALPQEVITALPTGDTHDGRVDTEVFGAPYEFVELYLNWRCLGETQQQTELAALPPAEQATFQKLAANLEALHRHNAHKFRVGSPAVHLNLLTSAVPGGWKH